MDKFLDNSCSSSPGATGGFPQLGAAAGDRLTKKNIGSILRHQLFFLSSRSWWLATAGRSCWWSPDTEKYWTSDASPIIPQLGACHSWPQLLVVALHRKRLGQFMDTSYSSSPRAAGGFRQLGTAAGGRLILKKIGSLLRQKAFLLSSRSLWLSTTGRSCWWSPDTAKIGSILKQQLFLLSWGNWWLVTAGRSCWWSPDRRKRFGQCLDNRCSPSSRTAGGLPQLAAVGGLPQLAAAGGLPQLAAAGGLPQLAAAGGLPQLAAARGLPQLAAAGGLPQLAAAGGLPQLAAAAGGHLTAEKDWVNS